MPKAYLHIGSPKTGTTGFQSFLHEHGQWLNERGLFIPTVGTHPQGGHHPLALSLSGLLDRPHFHKIRSDFAAELHANGLPDFLISSETMCRYFWRQQSAKAITDFITSLGYEVIVILTLLDHAPFFRSAYTQRAKAVKSHVSLVEHLQGVFIKQPQWHFPTIRYLLADQCKCMAIPYNNKMKLEGSTATILKKLGIQDQIQTEPRLNTSPGTMQVYAGKWLSKYIQNQGMDISPTQQSILNPRLRNGLQKQFGKSEPYNPITQYSLDLIETNKDTETCNTLAQKYWGCDWDDAFRGDAPLSTVSNDWLDQPSTGPTEQTLKEIHEVTLEIWDAVQIEIPYNQNHLTSLELHDKLQELPHW
jgi:hypothetical protein